jgi:hypothetical protein
MIFLNKCKPLLLALLMAWPAFSQVQLFEQDASGLVPYVGFKYNQGIQEYLVGLEYTVEARTTFGVNFSSPFKDSLYRKDSIPDTDLKSYAINPYVVFEFIEPGSLGNFSFSMRADWIQENTFKKTKSTPVVAADFNAFQRTSLGGGPIFAYRILKSEKLAIIPSFAYELLYVNSHKTEASKPFDHGDENVIWHDISANCIIRYFLNDNSGLMVEPKVIAKIGDGRASDDLINAMLTVGYIRKF